MTQTTKFDTHEYVKQLTGAGFTLEQAEILAKSQFAMQNGNAVTRPEFETFMQDNKAEHEKLWNKVSELGSNIEILRHEVFAKIEAKESESQRFTIRLMLTQTAILVAAFVAIIQFI